MHAHAPPINPPSPSRPRAAHRVGAGVLAGCALAVLITAASLTPSDAGIGTHTQLGLPPCGWILAANLPCPTCGMTTAFSAAANTDFFASFKAQPMGTFLAVLTAAFFWGALHVCLTGSRLGEIAGRLLSTRAITALVALGALAWLYKIAQVRGW